MTDQNWESAVNVITVLILGFLTALAADTTFDLYNQLTFHNYSKTGRMPQRKTFGGLLKTVYLQAGCLPGTNSLQMGLRLESQLTTRPRLHIWLRRGTPFRFLSPRHQTLSHLEDSTPLTSGKDNGTRP